MEHGDWRSSERHCCSPWHHLLTVVESWWQLLCDDMQRQTDTSCGPATWNCCCGMIDCVKCVLCFHLFNRCSRAYCVFDISVQACTCLSDSILCFWHFCPSMHVFEWQHVLSQAGLECGQSCDLCKFWDPIVFLIWVRTGTCYLLHRFTLADTSWVTFHYSNMADRFWVECVYKSFLHV